MQLMGQRANLAKTGVLPLLAPPQTRLRAMQLRCALPPPQMPLARLRRRAVRAKASEANTCVAP